jgi:magnesium and cobalt transporter
MKLTELSRLSGKDLSARYAETCGGLVQEVTGRIPEEGEEINISGYIFRIVSRDGPRLERMEVRLSREHDRRVEE